MPLFNYVCGCGEVQKKYFKTTKESPKSVGCKCGLEAVKGFGATSSSHKIVIDNGLMSKSVEVDPEIMEINDQRAAVDYSEDE